jgi:UDP-N-acetylglucosamine 2-epimerase (non-hydrolysing)
MINTRLPVNAAANTSHVGFNMRKPYSRTVRIAAICGKPSEAIKMLPVIAEGAKYNTVKIFPVTPLTNCAALTDVFKVFGVHLNCTTPSLDHLVQDGIQNEYRDFLNFSYGLSVMFAAKPPDVMLIQGDTAYGLAGAIFANHHKIPLAHIEAGFRTKSKSEPFPEEYLRRVLTISADIFFPPTMLCYNNLMRHPDVEKNNVFLTGNTIVDAYQRILQAPLSKPNSLSIPENKKVIIVDIHRNENTGSKFKSICKAISSVLGREADHASIVFLSHPHKDNPARQNIIDNTFGRLNNIFFAKRIPYDEFLRLVKRSYLVISDSGGLQEEAPALGIPLLVVRKETERTEAVEAGVSKLIGSDPDNIRKELSRFLRNEEVHNSMAKPTNLYGDGQASRRIIEAMLYVFGVISDPPLPPDLSPIAEQAPE